MDTLNNETHEVDTLNQVTANSNELRNLIEEATRLNQLIASAKTSLKKSFYKKKLDKVKQKTYRMLIKQAIANPELLKKHKEDENE